MLTKATVHRAYSLYVGNLCNTGHSAEAAPPAGMAEKHSADSGSIAVAPPQIADLHGFETSTAIVHR